MDKPEILELINSNPVFHLATLEEGEPRIRGMLLYRADEEGILFHTGVMKDVYRQLTVNPVVELCFYDQQRMIQVRVRGRAKLIPNQALKEEIVNSPGREFLKPLVQNHGFNVLAVFRVVDCQALIWTMATNLAPKELIRVCR